MCFSESERDPRYVGLIGKQILKKDWGNGKKYHELKAEFVCLSVVCTRACVRVCVCVCVCVCETLTALISLQSFSRHMKNVNLLKKDFKSAGLLI